MKNKRIQPNVHQRFGDDCGIACLSMLFNLPYLVVYKLLIGDYNGHERWEGCTEDHVEYLSTLTGHTAICDDVSPDQVGSIQKALKGHPAVLVCPAKDGSTDYHAVYWTGYELFDPAPMGLPRYPKNGSKAFKSMIAYWRITSP